LFIKTSTLLQENNMVCLLTSFPEVYRSLRLNWSSPFRRKFSQKNLFPPFFLAFANSL